MQKQSNKYWKDRANARMDDYHKNSDVTIAKINGAYDKAIADINSDINNIVYNFKLKGDLSNKEVKQLLNSKIPNPILKIVNRVIPRIKNKKIKQYLLNLVNAKAYKARITRLEALKNSIYIRSKQIADIELTESNLGYINTIKESYYRSIFDIQKGVGLGFDFASMPVSSIDEILSNKWSGENYSTRIWNNTDVLAGKLEEIITSGLMSGKSIKKMSKELVDMTGYGKMAAERLVRTETTYVANMAELQSYKECGIEKYVFEATLDLRTSNICREHDGKVYEVAKGTPGENLPPLHPYCRSTTVAYMGEKWAKGLTRRARDPQTGKTYIIQDMNYNEWYQKYVVGKYGQDKANTMEKAIRNKKKQKNNQSRANKLFTVYPPFKGDSVKSQSIYKELNKSSIGKDTLEHIKNNKINVEVYYDPDVLIGLKGQQIGNNIYINGLNTLTKKEVSKTIIHEVTHHKYNIGGSQKAECICDYMAEKHYKKILTISDLRNIIKSVKKRYPEYSWR